MAGAAFLVRGSPPPKKKIRVKYFMSLIKNVLPFILLNYELSKKIGAKWTKVLVKTKTNNWGGGVAEVAAKFFLFT
jgi:hypothetical protein